MLICILVNVKPDNKLNMPEVSQYSEKYKHLSYLLQKLTESGADAILEVPNIAVVGNQSAGKSSLIESITGVRDEYQGILVA